MVLRASMGINCGLELGYINSQTGLSRRCLKISSSRLLYDVAQCPSHAKGNLFFLFLFFLSYFRNICGIIMPPIKNCKTGSNKYIVESKFDSGQERMKYTKQVT